MVSTGTLPIGDVVAGIVLALVLFASHLHWPHGEAEALLAARQPTQVIVWTVLVALIVIVPVQQQPFIYFQF
jgi:hypothetical protein